VKNFKVHGQGKKSNAKQAIQQNEFLKILELFRKQSDWNHTQKYPMMALWQYHLIGRVDDVAHFKVVDPKGHSDYDFALKTRVRRSKNVMEGWQCPPQILLGVMDPLYCVLLQLRLYLEEYLGFFPNAKYLFTDSEGKNAAKNIKQTYRNRLERVVWKSGAFKALQQEDDEGGVGTHSMRKYASNYARGCGGASDEILVEIRGRWKSQGGNKVVFKYIDVKQLTIDATVRLWGCCVLEVP
jgi:hypothetical protein